MRSKLLTKSCGCLKPQLSQLKPLLPSMTLARGASASAKQESPNTLLTRLFNQNQEWMSESGSQFSKNVEDVLNKQIPQATLLTCCDSRVSSAALGLTMPNRTFEIRNIGNQAPNAFGSITYGVQVLKTPYLLIMGHTGCGAVGGALSDYSKLNSMVQRELLSLVKSVRFAQYVSGGDQDTKIEANTMAEINVDFQVLQVLQNLKMKESVDKGDLNVVGLMFDIHNAYGSGFGQVHFININGETNADSIKSNSLFKELSDEETDGAVRRLFSYPSSVNCADFEE